MIMLTQSDLLEFRNLIKEELKPVKEQLDIVEMKVEAVNKKVGQAQQETIEVLSDLIHTGHEIHEKRIKKLEEHAFPQ